MNSATTVGSPGMCFFKKGSIARMRISAVPPGALPLITVMVLP
ncbi:MAG: hypothetical protein ACREP5_00650 [Candidatus Binatia bacterium]